MVKICHCGKEFITYQCLINIGKGKYCSRPCASRTFFKKGFTPWNKGIKRPEIMGSLHPRWKGWRYCGRNRRYKMIHVYNHPFASKAGYVREHRLIMEQQLGRYLLSTEEVHHRDGNGLNNNIENLQLISSKSEHLQLEHRNGRYKNIWKKRRGI